MYQELNLRDYPTQPPSMLNTLTELPRTLLEVGSLMGTFPALSLLPRGDGHPVLLVPGFMAGDRSLVALKQYLKSLGYEAHTWGFGRNTGRVEHLLDQLPARLQQIHDESGRKVTLIGQSLGGVFARELARQTPDPIRQVITLGSPFGTRNSEVTMQGLKHLFKMSAGSSIEELVERMKERELSQSPNVPMTAIFSKGDGVVNWRVCREVQESETTQNIEILGSHCGMGFNPLIYYIIADRLRQPEDGWSRYKGCVAS